MRREHVYCTYPVPTYAHNLAIMYKLVHSEIVQHYLLCRQDTVGLAHFIYVNSYCEQACTVQDNHTTST